jgi:ferrous iron transport protein B
MPRVIALAGNPNSGKSTIFNALTGLRQKVANYPGVTVEKKTGRLTGLHGESMDAIDLPGAYSLSARSPDEAITRDVLLGRRDDTRRPDVVVSVVDAANLERNLYLTTQLLELGLPVIVALNMVDVAEEKGIRIDVAELSAKLGAPVIPLVASKNSGIVELKAALSRADLPTPAAPPISTDVAPEVAIEARYAWIHHVCADAVRHPGEAPRTLTERVDSVLTHRVWGWACFLAVMGLVFYSIFAIAAWPMDWIGALTDAAGSWVNAHLPAGDLRSLLSDGIIAGVGNVVVFLPQILILFFFLGILEDTGYMARAAFIMDRVMARVGLHGKSFIPLLSSFACAIPGVMAARTIENRNDRLATIMVAPLMSCSARLPVYTLMIAVLIPPGAGGAWTKAGIMLSMYLLGVAVAFTAAWIFKRTLFRSEKPMLLLEMPPYRLPAARTIVLRMFERAGVFLTQAGTVILALSIVLWALATYPKPPSPDTPPSVALEHSAAGWLGHAIEPVIQPLGFDWKIGIGLVASFAAREVFVGTMAIVNNVGGAGEESPSLRAALLAQKWPDGSPVYTPLVCIGLMVFYVLAMQCMSTLAVVRRETNSWRWPAFQFCYMAALAYAGSFLVFHVGHFLGFQ